ncbi:hypothetical protein HYQ45_000351 [Verticillium longisporum]|uniref:Uncharacterized protein n=1 Tax=Verticillium longisporum TaxID=100787 RepID=A0A8I3A3K5_VERLO|nr:hypothetical protein HYQ45_000351 [Verticillium longisporum]
MLQTSTILLAIAPLSALAQWDISTNFTFTLYPSDAGDSCEGGGQGGITLTTETIPRHETCIDIEEIFGGNERMGFLNDTFSERVTYPNYVDVDKLPPPGIEWYITSDSIDYDPAKNWSVIWFEQRNQSSDGKSEEGKDGRWVLDTYGGNNDCQRDDVIEFPWYETSCQTGETGRCEFVPHSIKSIKLRPFFHYDFGDCQTWAKYGAAATLVPRVSAAIVTTMAFFLFL